jgi:OOP family OmpA-OmpF porin
MTKLARLALFTACFAALLAGPAAAEDWGGCKDHPLFGRMPNHFIYGCDHSQFEMRRFPVGPMNKEGKAKLQEVEGEFWSIQYVINEGATKASGLQIQRNFQNAATKAGGTVEGTYPEWCTLELDESFKEGNPCTNYGTTLKLNKGGKDYWVFVNAVPDEKLNKDGFLSLYINFDTGKATIKPDSDKTLDDAAAALKAAPSLKVEVGGHTDNVGTPQANEKLSSDRAQAVMAALVKRGVAANRLTAQGYGQSSPIADNRSEDGRAKNRRVELVKK